VLPESASVNPLPLRNAGLLEAAILISLPVRGLRPVRASRCFASKLPNPVICTLSPPRRASAIRPLSTEKSASTTREAWALVRSARLASCWTNSDLFTA
jgi:hypothetical protein